MIQISLNKQQLDPRKFIDTIIKIPMVQQRIQDELSLALYTTDSYGNYTETKPAKFAIEITDRLCVDVSFVAVGRTNDSGKDTILLLPTCLLYENNHLLEYYDCQLFFNTPLEDYVEFDVLCHRIHSEISKEAFEKLEGWYQEKGYVGIMER